MCIRDSNKWIQYFKDKGIIALKINSKNKQGIKEINNAVQIACKEKIERDKKRGIINRPVRAMVVGIPNVGKSTFINAYAGRAAAKTGNKPGVTKGKQWIKLNKNLELLDTPGILWPKFDDQTIGMHLAFIGSMNDNVLDVTELAYQLVKLLATTYPKADVYKRQVFLCGHYEGIDERVLEMIVTDNVSIGDYVLTGGELPSMVMIDAISRLVPGVLNNDVSAEFESFNDNLLEYPQYTRPASFMEREVLPFPLNQVVFP